MADYRDYLAYWNSQQHGDGGDTPLSEEQWRRINPSQRWGMLGDSVAITPDDPRYQGLLGQVNGEAGRNIFLSGSRLNDSNLVNPAGQYAGDGFFAHSESNQTPGYQAERDISDTAFRNFLLTAAAVVGGGLAYGALGAGAAGAGEAGAGWGATGTGTAGVGAGATGAGAVDMGALGAAGAAAPDFSNVAGGGSTTATGAGLTGNAMVDGLLNGAMRNPLQTIGLIRTVGGMFGGNGNGGGGGNSSGQQKGGEGAGVGNPGAFQQQPYQPNPITAAQLQNMRFARPRGY